MIRDDTGHRGYLPPFVAWLIAFISAIMLVSGDLKWWLLGLLLLSLWVSVIEYYSHQSQVQLRQQASNLLAKQNQDWLTIPEHQQTQLLTKLMRQSNSALKLQIAHIFDIIIIITTIFLTLAIMDYQKNPQHQIDPGTGVFGMLFTIVIIYYLKFILADIKELIHNHHTNHHPN